MLRTSRFSLKSCKRFVQSHRRLLLFLSLLLVGFLMGCRLFGIFGEAQDTFLGTVLAVTRLEKGVKALAGALYSACFLPVLLLIVLFFCGLSACSLPLILAVPLFFGMGAGMSAAYYYSTGIKGVLLVAVLLVPPMFCKAAGLLMACAESMRMSLLLCGQLLPQRNACGGMPRDFKLYLLRFAVFLTIALGAGILDVLLRLLCQAWLL